MPSLQLQTLILDYQNIKTRLRHQYLLTPEHKYPTKSQMKRIAQKRLMDHIQEKIDKLIKIYDKQILTEEKQRNQNSTNQDDI